MQVRSLSRRSFFLRVTGALCIAGGAVSVISGNSYAQGARRTCLTDTDSTDQPGNGTRSGLTDTDGSDAEGRGTLSGRTDSDSVDAENRGRSWRCPSTTESQGYTGRSDSDEGASADRAGYGRTGVTDTDSTDRASYGRGGERGVTDNDTGASADPAGRGRGRRSTSVTDSDPSDPVGNGRRGGRGTGITDSDAGASADRVGHGRGGAARGANEEEEAPGSSTPPFPRWPPPRATERRELNQAQFAGDRQLGDVADRLMRALRGVGNPMASFYTAPGGFALVARLERIRGDARPFPGQGRFVNPEDGETPPPNNPLDALGALFFAPEGFYRQIVFVTTNRPFGSSQWTLSVEEADKILGGGGLDLSPDYRAQAFSPSHRVVALIYEFAKQGGRDAEIRPPPGRWNADTHLRRSGLLQRLGG